VSRNFIILDNTIEVPSITRANLDFVVNFYYSNIRIFIAPYFEILLIYMK